MSHEPLNILVVDDEAPLRETLRRSFALDGHNVVDVADGKSALDKAARERFDVVLLDVALGQGLDGYDVCRTLRERRNVVPIIMLTARDTEADAVLGLEAGADDYVTKPFGPAELRSRIRAVLRRAGGHKYGGELLRVDGLELDRTRREASIDGKPLELTFSEYELLRAIWGDSAYRDPRGIDVHVHHVREKIEDDPTAPKRLVTVRGAGYRMNGS